MGVNLRAMSRAELELVDTAVLDRAAYGFSSGDVIVLFPDQIKIRYAADRDNAARDVVTPATARRVLKSAPPVDVAPSAASSGSRTATTGGRQRRSSAGRSRCASTSRTTRSTCSSHHDHGAVLGLKSETPRLALLWCSTRARVHLKPSK